MLVSHVAGSVHRVIDIFAKKNVTQSLFGSYGDTEKKYNSIGITVPLIQPGNTLTDKKYLGVSLSRGVIIFWNDG